MSMTLLLRLKQSMENYHMVIIINMEHVIYFMILKEYLFLYQLTVIHLTVMIICIILIIHHYILYVIVINILLKLLVLLLLIQEEIIFLIMEMI